MCVNPINLPAPGCPRGNPIGAPFFGPHLSSASAQPGLGNLGAGALSLIVWFNLFVNKHKGLYPLGTAACHHAGTSPRPDGPQWPIALVTAPGTLAATKETV